MSLFPALATRPRRTSVILCILALAALVAAVMLGGQPPGTTQASPSGKIYWTDRGTDKIQRANLDGTGVEDLIIGLDTPGDIALDVSGGKMYWTSSTVIQRANLDGSGVEDVVTGLNRPTRIALDLGTSKIYWTDSAVGKVQRANLDGTSVEDIFTQPGLDLGPIGIAVDPTESKIYFTVITTIKRANLDGTGLKDVTNTSLFLIGDIALDVSGGRIYWTEFFPPTTFDPSGSGLVGRANLDGSGTESLVSTVLPLGIALDVIEGKVYWTEGIVTSGPVASGEPRIRRANLDGTGVEDLITGLDSPFGIALDVPMPIPPTPTPFDFGGTPVVVGGIVSDLGPDGAGLPLETAESSDSNALLGGVAAAIAISAVAVGGAAWYARR